MSFDHDERHRCFSSNERIEKLVLGSSLGQQRLPERSQCDQRGITQTRSISIRSVNGYALFADANGFIVERRSAESNARRDSSRRSEKWCCAFLVLGKVSVRCFGFSRARRHFRSSRCAERVWKRCVKSTTVNKFLFRKHSVMKR